MNAKTMKTKKRYVGGQAIIEGVMMKGKRIVAACRRSDGSIAIKTLSHSSYTEHFPLGLPFIRGIVFLFEMLGVGINALTWSANQQVEEKEKLSASELTLTMVVSLLLAAGLFLVLPYAAAWLAIGDAPSTISFNLLEGFVRLILFVAYIYLIGLSKDVRRLYQYHGAEHAAVNCYEHGEPLTVKNVMKYSTVHIRCGTSLLVYVLGISILVFSLLSTGVWYYNVLLRLIFIPIIGGIGYELLRLSARFKDNAFLWVLTIPGKLTQRITTQRPDAKQVEVAIVALKRSL
jgi:uncharacterized protein YqhQ